jgi:hypothetical protein
MIDHQTMKMVEDRNAFMKRWLNLTVYLMYIIPFIVYAIWALYAWNTYPHNERMLLYLIGYPIVTLIALVGLHIVVSIVSLLFWFIFYYIANSIVVVFASIFKVILAIYEKTIFDGQNG